MVTDRIESYRDNARACTQYRLISSDPKVPQFAIMIDDFMMHQMKGFADYPSPEDQLWIKRKQWEMDQKVWRDAQVPTGNPYDVTYTQPYYATSTGQPLTIQYDNSTQAYPTLNIPVQLVNSPSPEPKEETPMEWLHREVDEVCDLAWAA